MEVTARSADLLVYAMGNEGDRVLPRLERGSRAFAVLDGGRVVAYGWLATGPEWIGELEVEFTPAAGEAYIWNCLTLPEHRRRGHYRALLEGIVAQARQEGLARTWIGSIEDPAEKADADAGFSPVLHFEVTKVLGLRMLRVGQARGADPALVLAARERMSPWRAVGRTRTRVH